MKLMNYEELLVYLDLNTPDEFEYFEAMADLVECEEYIEQEAVEALFRGADGSMIAELLEDYFEDIMNGLPDDSGEIYSLLDQIKLCLEGLIMNSETDQDIRRFTGEFCRFRNWYSEESEVEVTYDDDNREELMCIRDAITCARMEGLGGESCRYDFRSALDYEIDGYTMSLAELATAEEDENDGMIVFNPDEDEEYV